MTEGVLRVGVGGEERLEFLADGLWRDVQEFEQLARLAAFDRQDT